MLYSITLVALILLIIAFIAGSHSMSDSEFATACACAGIIAGTLGLVLTCYCRTLLREEAKDRTDRAPFNGMSVLM